MKYLLATFVVLWGFLGCKAAFKEPGWKHCIIPLHALPNQWGRVTSPGFPNGINTQIQCSWVISSNPGYRIKLAFQTLNMTGSMKSCYTQFVEVLDYKIGSSVGKFCGARRPGDYVSYGTRLRFDLQGDTSGDKTKGFELRFKATKEPGGFKSKWSFQASSSPKSKPKPGRPKKPKKPSGPPKSKPPSGGGGGVRSPPKAAPPKPPSNPPSRPLPPGKPSSPKAEAPAPPPPPRKPAPKNKIEFRPPPPRKYSGPVIYGANTGHRGVDHGKSNVISISDEPEEELNIYLIAGVSAGGVVALIVIFVIMKLCVFDKNKKKKKRRKELEKQKSQNPEAQENVHMSVLPGSVPEQYMSEQIVPQNIHPYHRTQTLPMMSSVSRHHFAAPYAHSARAAKSRTAPPMASSRSRGPRSSRSRARSSKSRDASSRRSEMHRSKSRTSLRRSKSRSSIRRSKSKSSQYLPHMEGQWVMLDPRHPGEFGVPPTDHDSTTTVESSSTDWETDSSDSYVSRKNRRRPSNRRNSMPRMKSNPPPYDSLAKKPVPYYVIEKGREFDEGYDTGRRTAGTKSTMSRKKRNSRKTKSRASERDLKSRRSRRKYSY